METFLERHSRRESNLELLRIISMLLIVCGHLIAQGVSPELNGDLPISVQIMSKGSRIAVSIFLLIGTWFMVDSKFCARRVLLLYCQLAFWILLLTWMGGAIYGVTIKQLVWSLIPYTSCSLWFVSVYLALILLAPFINFAINSRKRHKVIVCLLGYFCCIQPTIYQFVDGWLDCLGFFVFIYVAIAYYKHYLQEKIRPNKYVFIISGIGLYVAIVIIKNQLLMTGATDDSYAVKKLGQFLSDYKTLPNLFIASSIFYFFKETNLGKSKLINMLASNALGVYIIHQTPAFQGFLWKNVLHCNYWANSQYLTELTIFMTLLVYLGLSILAFIYTLVLEPKLQENKTYKFLESKINNFYN